jgi:hypothetical protein
MAIKPDAAKITKHIYYCIIFVYPVAKILPLER